MKAVSPQLVSFAWLLLPGVLNCGAPRMAPASVSPGSAPSTDRASTEPVASSPAAQPTGTAGPEHATSSGGEALAAWMHDAAQKITTHAHGKTRAWDRLAFISDRYGHRLSGSRALEQTIDWAVETMTNDGLSEVRREPVMVPHWVRGAESLRIVGGSGRELTILGLGMSVGTRGALRGLLVVVPSLEALERSDATLDGAIVLLDQAMPPFDAAHNDPGYGQTVPARIRGASAAARRGAKALLVRSVTATSLNSPHTGSLRYEPGVPKIPAAAVTLEGAALLRRDAARGPVTLELRMGAKMRPDARSANVIAELKGTEHPEQIVLIGGHIDSWDVGDGSSDDGAGCLMAMEAALILKELGLVPRRTIRVVLFTNEENGMRGAKAYFEAHGHQPHVAAIESDTGSGAPRGMNIASKDEAVIRELSSWSPLFAGLGATEIVPGWGGADIQPLMEQGVLGLSVRPDIEHYFDLHHSPADTVDKIDPDHLQRNAAVMALMAYLLAQREPALVEAR